MSLAKMIFKSIKFSRNIKKNAYKASNKTPKVSVMILNPQITLS